MWGQSFFMPNFDWLLQCVKDNMDVSQDFRDNPRMLSRHQYDNDKQKQWQPEWLWTRCATTIWIKLLTKINMKKRTLIYSLCKWLTHRKAWTCQCDTLSKCTQSNRTSKSIGNKQPSNHTSRIYKWSGWATFRTKLSFPGKNDSTCHSHQIQSDIPEVMQIQTHNKKEARWPGG